MKLFAILVIVLAFVAKSYTQTEELDRVFSQLEGALTHDNQISNKIDSAKKEILAEINKDPGKGAKVLEAAKTLNTAVKKLQNTDPWVVTQGALDVVAGIVALFPKGQVFAAIISVISSVIGIVTGQKAEQTLTAVVTSAVRDESDSQLIGTAKGAQQEIATAYTALTTYINKKIDDKAAAFLTTQIKMDKGIAALEMLAHRIGERKTSTDGNQQLNCYRLSLLYAQLATMRDMVINNLVMQLKISEHEDFAQAYSNSLKANKGRYKNAIGFLADPEIAEAGVAHLFYPPDHSKASMYIKQFLARLAGVTVQQRSVNLPARTMVFSKHWTHDFLALDSILNIGSYYLAFDNAVNMLANSDGPSHFSFHKLSNGYWNIKVGEYWLVLSDKYLATKTRTFRSTQAEGQFLIMAYKDPKIFTISSKKSPGYFWKGESGQSYVIVTKGYSGEKSQFTYK